MMLESVWSWDMLAPHAVAHYSAGCAVTSRQIQFCLLGTAQAEHASFTGICFPSKKAINWATLVI